MKRRRKAKLGDDEDGIKEVVEGGSCIKFAWDAIGADSKDSTEVSCLTLIRLLPLSTEIDLTLKPLLKHSTHLFPFDGLTDWQNYRLTCLMHFDVGYG